MNRTSYNAIAREWDQARWTLDARERPFLDLLVRDLAPSAHILDLGCGTGRPIAEFLLRAGFRVTGVDQAEALLALARERLPAGRWIHAEIESFEPEEIYDGAVLWDSLFHIPREPHEAILKKVVRALRPSSIVILTAGGSGHPAFTDTMFDQPFFYDSHSPETICSILEGLGTAIEHAAFLDLPTDGRDKGRFAVAARVRGNRS